MKKKMRHGILALTALLLVTLSGLRRERGTDEARGPTPQHRLLFCRRLGPVCQHLREAGNPTVDQSGAQDAGHRPHCAGGRAVQERVRHGAELHAVPQFALVGAVLLSHGPRRDLARRGVGFVHSELSAAVARRGLPHRQDLQGLEPGAPADAPYGGQNYAYEKAGSRFSHSLRQARPGDGAWRHDRRGGQAARSSHKYAAISTPFSPTASPASHSATGSAPRSRTGRSKRAPARRCGASIRIP